MEQGARAVKVEIHPLSIFFVGSLVFYIFYRCVRGILTNFKSVGSSIYSIWSILVQILTIVGGLVFPLFRTAEALRTPSVCMLMESSST